VDDDVLRDLFLDDSSEASEGEYDGPDDVIVGGAHVGPPVPHVGHPLRGPASRATVMVRVGDFGTISFYEHNRRFHARCKGHGCTLQRSNKPSAVGAAAKGRPLGLLLLWLQRSGNYHNKHDHHNPFSIMLCSFLRAERMAAREYLATLPNGVALLECERPKRPDEPDEPEGFP